MAEDVVEDVRLFQIVELVRPADEATGGKAPVGQVIEEHLVGHEAGHGDDRPAGQGVQLAVHLTEVRYALAVQVQRLQSVQELVARSPRQQRRLALVEGDPDLVLGRRIGGPVLIDGPVGTHGLNMRPFAESCRGWRARCRCAMPGAIHSKGRT